MELIIIIFFFWRGGRGSSFGFLSRGGEYLAYESGGDARWKF